MYKDIQETLSEADRGKLQRSMGMKMEQLKVLCDNSSLPNTLVPHYCAAMSVTIAC